MCVPINIADYQDYRNYINPTVETALADEDDRQDQHLREQEQVERDYDFQLMSIAEGI